MYFFIVPILRHLRYLPIDDTRETTIFLPILYHKQCLCAWYILKELFSSPVLPWWCGRPQGDCAPRKALPLHQYPRGECAPQPVGLEAARELGWRLAQCG